MPHEYGRMAEFHDLFMNPAWELLRPSVARFLGPLPPGGTIVEVGAGTGIGTRVIASESPARIMAMEPDLVMRSVLTARVFDSPDLASRVTVLAGGVPEELSHLPERAEGFVCAHVLGHLGEEARGELFSWLGRALSEAGVGLVTTQDPSGRGRTEDPDRREPPLVTLGSRQYRAHHLPGRGEGGYATRYQVLSGGRVVHEAVCEGSWEVFSHEDLVRALAGSNLVGERAGPGVSVIRRRG